MEGINVYGKGYEEMNNVYVKAGYMDTR